MADAADHPHGAMPSVMPSSVDFGRLQAAFEDIALPRPVAERARVLLADDLSLAVDASRRDFGRRLGAGLHALHRCERGLRWPPMLDGLPPAEAALLLGAMIHAAEQDDTHVPSIVHGGAVLVPAALVSARSHAASGARMLRAMVLGWEVLIRLALHAPGAFQRRGFQASAVLGPLAAALAAGWLRGLSPQQLRQAMGIALSFSSGPLTYLVDGADSKKLHLGWAARSGIVAAELAAQGITGPGEVLTGERSVFRLFGDTSGPAHPVDLSDLGQRWHLLEVSFKQWPCCHYLQGFLEAIGALRTQAGARSIRALHCHVPQEVTALVCRPQASGHASTDIDARFSLAYVVKALLVDGRIEAESFEPASLRRLDAQPMPVRLSWEPWADSGFPLHYPARVDAELADGTRLSREVRALPGSPERPLDEAVLRERFFARTTPVLGEARAAALWARLAGIEQADGTDFLS